MCSLSMNFYRRRRSYSAGRDDFLYDKGIVFISARPFRLFIFVTYVFGNYAITI